ncbi:MAG: hypothetical protein H6604_08460 [Flavobacteriales bacterium]|nr:hypothetical protein [Flavobacteriales bacterium]
MKTCILFLMMCYTLYSHSQIKSDSCEVIELDLFTYKNRWGEITNEKIFKQKIQILKGEILDFDTFHYSQHKGKGMVLSWKNDSIFVLREKEKSPIKDTIQILVSDINTINKNFGFVTINKLNVYSPSLKLSKVKKESCLTPVNIPINDSVYAIKTIRNNISKKDTVYWLDGRIFNTKNHSIKDLQQFYDRRYPKFDSIYRKFPIALLPSKTDKVSGLALSVWAKNIKNTKDITNPKHSVTVNGMLIDANPAVAAIHGFIIFTFHAPFLIYEVLTTKEDLSNFTKENEEIMCYVNGISISSAQTGSIAVSGMNIAGTSSIIYEFKGVSITSLLNAVGKGRGVQLALINYSGDMKGVQAGIINKTNHLKGFQFGLWNVNQCGKFPIVNFCFKEKKD